MLPDIPYTLLPGKLNNLLFIESYIKKVGTHWAGKWQIIMFSSFSFSLQKYWYCYIIITRFGKTFSYRWSRNLIFSTLIHTAFFFKILKSLSVARTSVPQKRANSVLSQFKRGKEHFLSLPGLLGSCFLLHSKLWHTGGPQAVASRQHYDIIKHLITKFLGYFS